MDDAEFLRQKIKQMTEVLDARTALLMCSLTALREIGDEHFIADKFLQENKTGIEQFSCSQPTVMLWVKGTNNK